MIDTSRESVYKWHQSLLSFEGGSAKSFVSRRLCELRYLAGIQWNWRRNCIFRRWAFINKHPDGARLIRLTRRQLRQREEEGRRRPC